MPTKPNSYGTIDPGYTGLVPDAKSVADVEAGKDVYVWVLVELDCHITGGGTHASWDFDNFGLISVPKVCMEILSESEILGTFYWPFTPALKGPGRQIP